MFFHHLLHRKIRGIPWLFIAMMIQCVPGALPTAQAGSLVSVSPMNFGRIILDPLGDTIEIDASSGKEAVSRVRGNGRSVIVEEGHSGMITYKCQAPGERITLLFPSRVEAKDHPSSHYINGFYTHSAPTHVVCQDEETIDLHIGGLLHLKKGQPYKKYGFELSVTIQSDNP